MRALLVVILVLAGAKPVLAEASINFGMDLGGVVGHGPLVERLDPVSSAGADATITLGRWMVDGGLLVMRSYGGPDASSAPAMRSSRGAGPDLDAFGWTAAVRRHLAPTGVGTTFVGLGFSSLGLHRSGESGGRAGHAWGPKLTAGLDLIGNARGRRMGVVVSATYQWLTARFEDGRRSAGGFTGLELTLLHGWGTCRSWTMTNCGGRD